MSEQAKGGAQPLQDEETARRVLAGQPAASATATGLAAADLRGDKGVEEGDYEEPEVQSVGDFAKQTAGAPIGQQAQPAAYAVNGTIPANTVASPSGPVPSQTVRNPEEALESTYGKQAIADPDRELSEDEVAGLSAPELRAIASQRGYDIGPEQFGARTTRRRFLDAQAAKRKPAKAKASS